MINGTLVVNLDPPYCLFRANALAPLRIEEQKQWTTAEIKNVLLELGAIESTDHSSLKECFVRVRGDFPATKLLRLGLVC